MNNELEITPIKRENEKLYKKVINTIMTLIEKGELEYGDKLYNEEELIRKLNVSRSTLREALRVLEFMDVLTVAPKRGIVINDPKDRTDYPPLAFILQFEKIPKKHIIQLRMAIEMQALRSAIRDNISEEEINNLKKLQEEYIKVKEIDFDEKVVVDNKIHDYIVQLSNNITLIRLYNTFHDLFQEQLIEAVKNVYMSDKYDELVETHSGLINAIIEKDVEKGSKILENHFVESLHNYLK
jgi:GntR family transcriptional repressor for pyruvate dehydrogenase complex